MKSTRKPTVLTVGWIVDKLKYSDKVFLIQYHLVWCPKRRKPVLVGEVKEGSSR
jgi:hypothetical protein